MDTATAYTDPVRVNLTISIEEKVLDRARALAQERGISLQDLLRRYLESIAGQPGRAEAAAELLDLMEQHGGRSGGKRPVRGDAYGDRA